MAVTKNFYIKVLTPVHIGCDEVYDPLSFVVDEVKKELVVFAPIPFFKALSDHEKERLCEICKKGTISSILEVMKFIRGKKAEGVKVRVSEGFLQHYNQKLAMGLKDERRIQQELNRFEIKRTAFNPIDNKPIIPGSSVKGAIRTAYLNHLAKKRPDIKSNPEDKKANKKLEQNLLNYDEREIHTDPFRLIKVSDFMPVKASTRIVYAVNEKKIPDNKMARGLSQILEIIEPDSLFVGTISIDENKDHHPLIKHPLTLLEALNSLEFYAREKKREEEELKDAGLNPCPLIFGKGHPLRIGHHSGAESVTIEGHRRIDIKRKKGKYVSDKATTVWLASEVYRNYDKNKLLPFGWALLWEVDFVAEDIEKKGEKEVYNTASAETAPTKPFASIHEEWSSALLTWNPGSQELKVMWEGKSATHKGKEIIPEDMRKDLVERKKSVKARVMVQKVYNMYKIVNIEKGCD